MTKDFPIADGLYNKGCKHCAALFLIKPVVGFRPKAEYRNGTLTFIKYNGLTYGVTCKHVVESLREKKEELNDQNLCFATVVNRNIFIIDRFQFPLPGDSFTQGEPDIAIQQIHPGLCKSIRKEPINLNEDTETHSDKIGHALAVGFPEEQVNEKDLDDFPGYQLQMACVHALAELNRLYGYEFTLFSELDTSPDAINLSGMSGGPIFWSTEDQYGLLGITNKAFPIRPETEEPSDVSLGGGPRVVIKGQRITYERFGRWVDQLGINKTIFHSEQPMRININISVDES